MKREAIIEFKGISKIFGSKRVLDRIDLEVHSSEILGIIGKSGCGKSTLMKLLLGIYMPDEGSIIIEGRDMGRSPIWLKRMIGYTTQENSFYDKLTIYENMVYYCNLYSVTSASLGKPVSEHINSILESVGLLASKDTVSGRISGGMKRRLDFAISLVHEPKILILDEPTTGLDPILVEEFWKIVKKVRDSGKTVIVTSHIFSELESSCDRVVVMNKGKFVKTIHMHKEIDLLDEFKKAL